MGGVNLYGFANGDPVNFTDPFGLCPPIHSCLAKLRGAFSSAVNTGRAIADAVAEYVGSHPEIQQAIVDYASSSGAARIGSARVGTRYMGADEASIVRRTGTIPATNARGRPRIIHYTTDEPTMSASAAESRYNLPETPTHVCRFPVCAVQNDVPPSGTVAPGATQAATSLPINRAGRPLPLRP
jgi:hypothetical protein